MKKSKNYAISSGNVFEDLCVKNSEEMLTKAQLTYQINSLIIQKKLTQIEAAELLGIDQPKISDLTNGKLSGFSLERLNTLLNDIRKPSKQTIKNYKSRSS
jgi:predicted XRE-type DNA-binding protein